MNRDRLDMTCDGLGGTYKGLEGHIKPIEPYRVIGWDDGDQWYRWPQHWHGSIFF